jgi:hypothetical protein
VDGGEYIVPLVYTVSLRGKLVTVPVEGDALPEGVPVLVPVLLVDELVHAAAVVIPSNTVAAIAANLATRRPPVFLVVGLTGPTSSGYAFSLRWASPVSRGGRQRTRGTIGTTYNGLSRRESGPGQVGTLAPEYTPPPWGTIG